MCWARWMPRVRRGFTEVRAKGGKPAVFAARGLPGTRALPSLRGTATWRERWMLHVRRGLTEARAKGGKPAAFAARQGPGRRALPSLRGTAMCWERWMLRASGTALLR
jgi:hypothetical protein